MEGVGDAVAAEGGRRYLYGSCDKICENWPKRTRLLWAPWPTTAPGLSRELFDASGTRIAKTAYKQRRHRQTDAMHWTRAAADAGRCCANATGPFNTVTVARRPSQSDTPMVAVAAAMERLSFLAQTGHALPSVPHRFLQLISNSWGSEAHQVFRCLFQPKRIHLVSTCACQLSCPGFHLERPLRLGRVKPGTAPGLGQQSSGTGPGTRIFLCGICDWKSSRIYAHCVSPHPLIDQSSGENVGFCQYAGLGSASKSCIKSLPLSFRCHQAHFCSVQCANNWVSSAEKL